MSKIAFVSTVGGGIMMGTLFLGAPIWLPSVGLFCALAIGLPSTIAAARR